MTAQPHRRPACRLRPATRDDLPGIVDIYNASVPGRLATADTQPITVADREDWFVAHQKPERPLVVAVDEHANTALLGWASFSNFYGRPAYNGTVELAVYVAPNAQGRGIARTLVQHLLDRAPDLGVHTVLGFVFSHNQPSLNLLGGLGFTPWGELPEVAILDGTSRGLTIVGRKV
ncbi:GNAT family N-acetyltransferase [Salinispirillum sp. LH 10-3-1]|uniref:GNAT family N-acetyltransferase n=1 Tax=Salinispirillum sp. LH 10-3-1 TaxID=2952525 RepID=A0AB38YCQ3_9GAMM